MIIDLLMTAYSPPESRWDKEGPATHLYLVLIACRSYEKKRDFTGPPLGGPVKWVALSSIALHTQHFNSTHLCVYLPPTEHTERVCWVLDYEYAYSSPSTCYVQVVLQYYELYCSTVGLSAVAVQVPGTTLYLYPGRLWLLQKATRYSEFQWLYHSSMVSNTRQVSSGMAKSDLGWTTMGKKTKTGNHGSRVSKVP